MFAGSQLARTIAPGRVPSRVACCAPQRPLGVAVDDVDRGRRAPAAQSSPAATCAPARRRGGRGRDAKSQHGSRVRSRRLRARATTLEGDRLELAGHHHRGRSPRAPSASAHGQRRASSTPPGSGDSLNVALTIAARLPNDPLTSFDEIVAGDVLHDLAAGLRERRRRSVASCDADDQIARRAVAVAQRTAVVGREHAADRRASANGGSSGSHWPCRASASFTSRSVAPASTVAVRSPCSCASDAVQPRACSSTTSMRCRRPAPVDLRAAAADHDRLPLRPTRAAMPRRLSRGAGTAGSPAFGRRSASMLPIGRSTSRSARPAASTGCGRYGPGTSPHSRGVGNTLPGLQRPLRIERRPHALHQRRDRPA